MFVGWCMFVAMNKSKRVVGDCVVSKNPLLGKAKRSHKKHKHKSKRRKHGSLLRIPVLASSVGSTTATAMVATATYGAPANVRRTVINDNDNDDEDDDEDDDDEYDDDCQPVDEDNENDVDEDDVLFHDCEDQPSSMVAGGPSNSNNSLKLKFKLGQRSVAIVHESDEENDQLIEVVDDDVPPTTAIVSSDEDAWLDALESGRLDEYDELARRMKDPALMTARQKALLESKTLSRQPSSTGHQVQQQQPSGQQQPGIEYLMLPLGYKEKEMTEEMIKKRELKAKKRRQQAQEKREKDKIQTIDRLLKKQESKPKGSKARTHRKLAAQLEVPRFTYISSRDKCSISVPIGYSFPLQPISSSDVVVPTVVQCGVPQCTNAKKYSCSKTGVPLCSLQCYKVNLMGVFKV